MTNQPLQRAVDGGKEFELLMKVPYWKVVLYAVAWTSFLLAFRQIIYWIT